MLKILAAKKQCCYDINLFCTLFPKAARLFILFYLLGEQNKAHSHSWKMDSLRHDHSYVLWRASDWTKARPLVRCVVPGGIPGDAWCPYFVVSYANCKCFTSETDAAPLKVHKNRALFWSKCWTLWCAYFILRFVTIYGVTCVLLEWLAIVLCFLWFQKSRFNYCFVIWLFLFSYLFLLFLFVLLI